MDDKVTNVPARAFRIAAKAGLREVPTHKTKSAKQKYMDAFESSLKRNLEGADDSQFQAVGSRSSLWSVITVHGRVANRHIWG